MDRRFRKHHRITKRTDFDLIYRDGKYLSSDHFRVHILDRKSDADPRLGISASKRIGNSVVRNRIKRLVREWFRMNKVELMGLDIIVTAKPDAAKLGLDEISKELSLLISHHSLLQN